MSRRRTAQLPCSLADEAATIRLGEDLALALKAGDWLALSGDLGAGKSIPSPGRFCARLADDERARGRRARPSRWCRVTSCGIPVAHFDLYRLGDGAELEELGFDEALSQRHLPGGMARGCRRRAARRPASQLRLEHERQGPDARRSRAPAAQMQRIRRVLAIRAFLDESTGYPGRPAALPDGRRVDCAPTRACRSRIGETLILMDGRALPEGPAVLDGKPYPQVAHLAEESPIPSWRSHECAARAGPGGAGECCEVDYDRGLPADRRSRQQMACRRRGRQAHRGALPTKASRALPIPARARRCAQDLSASGTATSTTFPTSIRTAMKMEARLAARLAPALEARHGGERRGARGISGDLGQAHPTSSHRRREEPAAAGLPFAQTSSGAAGAIRRSTRRPDRFPGRR